MFFREIPFEAVAAAAAVLQIFPHFYFAVTFWLAVPP